MAQLDLELIKKAHAKVKYTPEMADELAKCTDPITGPMYFMENFMMIQHPTKGRVQFKPFDYQRELCDVYNQHRYSIAMIGRQLGKTTLAAGYLLWYAMFVPDSTILVAAHKRDGATEIMQRMRKLKNKGIEYSDSVATLHISLPVIRKFKKYEQKKDHNESGGILLGYVTRNCSYVQKVTTPNKYDSKGLTFFIRSKKPAQKHINRSWKKSKGALIYLGEWHTHHESEPKPSHDDINMTKRALKNTEMEIDFLYLIIVGLNANYWVGRCTSNGLVRINVT